MKLSARTIFGKKLLPFMLTVVMLAISCLPASTVNATSFRYEREAYTLNNMGLYAGISTDSFVPDLGSTVTKEQGVTLILRALGYNSYAMNMTEDQIATIFSIFSDADQVSAWARPYMAAGISLGLVHGNGNFTLAPQALMDSKMMAKLILANTEYTIDVSTYQSGPYVLRDHGAFTLEEAAYFMSKSPLIRDDLVGMMFLSLKLRYNGTYTSIIGRLVDEGLVSEMLALTSGTYNRDIIDRATAKVNEYEGAAYATSMQLAASMQLKADAERLIAKFSYFPNATSANIQAIKASLLSRIAAQYSKVTSTSTF